MRARDARIRILVAPQLHSDVLVVRRDGDGYRLIGRQPEGRGRVQRVDEPFVLEIGRRIELYSSETDLGRARLKRLPVALRDFLALEMPANGDVDVDDVDEIPLDIDGYV
jgi:hypothetical protein